MVNFTFQEYYEYEEDDEYDLEYDLAKYDLEYDPHDREYKQAEVSPEFDEYNETCFLSQSSPAKNTTSGGVLDSGCTTTMVKASPESFINYSALSKPILTAGSHEAKLQATGQGDLPVFLRSKGKKIRVNFTKVLNVPGLRQNLISTASLVDAGAQVVLKATHASIMTLQHVFHVPREGNLFVLPFELVNDDKANDDNFALLTDDDKVLTIHRLFGHVHLRHLQRILQDKHSKSYVKIDTSTKKAILAAKSLDCEGCVHGKATSKPLDKRSPEEQERKPETTPGSLLHLDLCGPFPNQRGGYIYILGILDDSSEAVAIAKLSNKKCQTVTDVFEAFDMKLFNKHGHHALAVRLDYGTEFTGGPFVTYCNKNGIVRQMSTPHKHGQNGKIERLWRTLVEAAVANLHHSNHDVDLLFDSLICFTFLYNRVPRPRKIRSPYYLFHGTSAEPLQLYPFGCLAYPVKPMDSRRKGRSRVDKCILIGYSTETKQAYLLFHLKTKKVLVRKDVSFFPTSFPSVNSTTWPTQGVWDVLDDLFGLYHPLIEEKHDDVAPVEEENQPDLDLDLEDNFVEEESEGDHFEGDHFEGGEGDFDESSRSDDTMDDPNPHALFSRPESEPPNNFAQAMQSPDKDQWLEACKRELSAHIKNKSFRTTKRLKGMKTVGSRWVFVKKEDGAFKARLVAKGFQQIKGLHFKETYAPTLSMASLRAVIAVGAQLRLTMAQMDVVTAFLIPRLPKSETVFMTIPDQDFLELAASLGLTMNHDDLLQLLACIYGLRQASHYWNNDLTRCLCDLGFTVSSADPCVFIKKPTANSTLPTFICTWVDDILLLGPSDSIDRVKKLLMKRFPMKDLGQPRMWTGIKIDQDEQGITLSQTHYIENILEKFSMSDCRPQPTPAASLRLAAGPLLSQEEQQRMNRVPYREAVGSLMWLMMSTRPDIAFAVSQVARFSHAPSPLHWTAVKRIFRYLQGTKDLALHYRQQENPQLLGYADADWAGDATRRSTGGHQWFFGESLILWKSKLQRCISLSSFESETVQLSMAAQAGVHLVRLFKDLGANQFILEPITIFEDNNSARISALNNSQSCRTRHIDVRHLYIRDLVRQGRFTVQDCSSEDMRADINTKPLPRLQFAFLRDFLLAPLKQIEEEEKLP